MREEWCTAPRADRSQGDGGPSCPVIVVSERPLFREGLVRLLRESGLEVVATVPSWERARELPGAGRPRVFVTDDEAWCADARLLRATLEEASTVLVVTLARDDILVWQRIAPATLPNLVRVLRACAQCLRERWR